jgi:hypothetical protein
VNELEETGETRLLSTVAHTANVRGAVNTQYRGRVACREVPSLSDATPSWRPDIGSRPSPPAPGQHELTKTYCTGVIGSPLRSVETSLRKEGTQARPNCLVATAAREVWLKARRGKLSP